MATFAEIEALVLEQTRRPEIPGITRAAIKSATLRAHHVDFFPRDKAEGDLVYTPVSGATYYDVMNVSTVLPRLRAPNFVLCLDSATFTPVEKLEYRDSDDLWDNDGQRRTSVYTLLGDTLRAYPLIATGRLQVNYFRNPIVAQLTYASWIADTYPEEIAMWSAGIVWARTGFTEMAKDTQDNHVKPFKELLIASHLFGNVN